MTKDRPKKVVEEKTEKMIIRERPSLKLEEEYTHEDIYFRHYSLPDVSIYEPLNDHHLLINTHKGICIFSTSNLESEPIPIITDGKMTLEIVPRADNQFIRLCLAKTITADDKDKSPANVQPVDSKKEPNVYSVEIWNVKKDQAGILQAECARRIPLEDIPAYNKGIATPTRILSLEPIRIAFGVLTDPNDVFSENQIFILTLSDEGKRIDKKQVSYISPIQILSNGRYAAIYAEKTDDNIGPVIFKADGTIESKIDLKSARKELREAIEMLLLHFEKDMTKEEKKTHRGQWARRDAIDASKRIKSLQESPDGEYLAFITSGTVEIYRAQSFRKLEEISGILTDGMLRPRWLADSTLICCTDDNVKLVNPDTREINNIFTIHKRIANLIVMPLSADILLIDIGKGMSLLELTQLQQRLKEIKSMLAVATGLPDELLGITRQYIGETEVHRLISEALSSKFVAPTFLPKNVQIEMKAEHDNLKDKIVELEKESDKSPDPKLAESLSDTRRDFQALNSLAKSLKSKQNPSQIEVQACVKKVRDDFYKAKRSLFAKKTSFSKLLEDIDKSPGEQKHIAASPPKKGS